MMHPVSNSASSKFKPFILEPQAGVTTIIDIDFNNIDGFPAALSTIMVQVSNNREFIMSIISLGNKIITKKISSARPNVGDDGTMIGIGKHAYNKSEIWEYASNDKLNPETVTRAARTAMSKYTQHFPSEIASIADAYSDACSSVTFDLGVLHGMIFSVDLCISSSHEDTNDTLQSIAT